MPPPGFAHGPGQAREKFPADDRYAVFHDMENDQQQRHDHGKRQQHHQGQKQAVFNDAQLYV